MCRLREQLGYKQITRRIVNDTHKWEQKLSRITQFNPEDGGGILLRNISIGPHYYTFHP
jgi:hypothetical protein